MKRYLEKPIIRDLKEKIVLLSGPRQVGKTTLSRQLLSSHVYLNHDSPRDRNIIYSQEWDRQASLIVFDELHKMKKWKSTIKGIYDTEGIPPMLLVTGSARLDYYRRGGDSLAGRYFSYRLHPLSLNEVCRRGDTSAEPALDTLLHLGGFPEPFLRGSADFARRWRRTHTDVIIRQDLLDMERVRDIKSIEILLDLLKTRVASPVSYSSLAGDLQVSPHTVKHWLQILENLYVIFPVRPFHKNIARSLLKEPKYYFYDVGDVDAGLGARLENVVALALLKEIHFLEDNKGIRASLHYLRDKDKNEVDFLVTINGNPVLMVEVKESTDSFSKSLFHFHRFVPSTQAIQLVHKLKRRKSTREASMMPIHDFLAELDLEKHIQSESL
jgi:predicted AAA+ superfamily ATPase